MTVWSLSGKNSLPNLQTAAFSLCLHVAFPQCMRMGRERKLWCLVGSASTLAFLVDSASTLLTLKQASCRGLEKNVGSRAGDADPEEGWKWQQEDEVKEV